MKSAHDLTVSYVIPALKKLGTIALVSLPFLAMSRLAFADGTNDFTSYATAVGDHTSSLPDVLTYVAYIIGAVTVGVGIGDMRKSAENSQQHAWKHGLAKLGFGGMLLALPFISGVISGTMTSGDPFALTLAQSFSFTGTAVKGGLGDYINKATNEASILINVAAFLAFIVAVFYSVRGIQMLR